MATVILSAMQGNGVHHARRQACASRSAAAAWIRCQHLITAIMLSFVATSMNCACARDFFCLVDVCLLDKAKRTCADLDRDINADPLHEFILSRIYGDTAIPKDKPKFTFSPVGGDLGASSGVVNVAFKGELDGDQMEACRSLIDLTLVLSCVASSPGDVVKMLKHLDPVPKEAAKSQSGNVVIFEDGGKTVMDGGQIITAGSWCNVFSCDRGMIIIIAQRTATVGSKLLPDKEISAFYDGCILVDQDAADRRKRMKTKDYYSNILKLIFEKSRPDSKFAEDFSKRNIYIWGSLDFPLYVNTYLSLVHDKR